MYFDFQDYRPDTPRLMSPISRREGVLLSLSVHLAALVVVLLMPELPGADLAAARLRQARLEELQRQRDQQRFVFVQPRVDLEALRPPPRAELSDKDREARTRERAAQPRNRRPFSRGNTPELVEAGAAPGSSAPPRPPARGPEGAAGSGAAPEPAPSIVASTSNGSALQVPPLEDAGRRAGQRPAEGALGEALRNLQRYVQSEMFDNPQGGTGEFGSTIQFDTKGVEFGPWIRRFVAQIKRNWFVPLAAMSLKGHVAITFNVDKDGAISDLAVAEASAVDAFNHSAFNALVSSNPTFPLPPEYPADRAVFRVTFYYNETPPPE